MTGPPVGGRRILVTRALDQARQWEPVLVAAGYFPVYHPLIQIGAPRSWVAFDAAWAQLSTYDWLVFTSVNAVRFALSRSVSLGRQAPLLWPSIAAVGPSTASFLQEQGLSVAQIPDDFRQEGLMATFRNLPTGTRVLFPRAASGRDDLPRFLTARGCVVAVVAVCETHPLVCPGPLPDYDAATFASSSALKAFVAAYGTEVLSRRPIIAIGSTTAAAARDLELSARVAPTPDARGIVAALRSLEIPLPNHDPGAP